VAWLEKVSGEGGQKKEVWVTEVPDGVQRQIPDGRFEAKHPESREASALSV